ncbi:hypothetical protein D3C76_857440 [compost metagenome]
MREMRTSMERSWPSYSMPRRELKISSRERMRPALEASSQSRSNSALVSSMVCSSSQASRMALSITRRPNARRLPEDAAPGSTVSLRRSRARMRASSKRGRTGLHT